MKKILFAMLAASALSFCTAYAEPVRDWKDLEKAHEHIKEAIHEMEHARAANHYDMKGHGEKAEEALRHAERELHDSIEALKAAR